MFTLTLLNEMSFTGFKPIALSFIYIISIPSSVLVVISKNPILSVLFLILLFSIISCYLIFSGLNFIGLSYLLVYVGAVSILFIFILMLLNVRLSELLIDSLNSIPLAILLGNFFNYFMDDVLSYFSYYMSLFFWQNVTLSHVTSSCWDGNIAEFSHIASIGNILYANNSASLIITSIILLVAMIGTIILTIKPQNDNYLWTNKSLYSLNSPKPHSFANNALQSGDSLTEILVNINALMPQLAGFINEFNTTVIQSEISVISDSMGNMSIDVPQNMPEYKANKLSMRIGIIDRCITTRGQEISDYLQKGMDLEKKIKMDDPNYKSLLTDKVEEFKRLNNSYKH